MTDTTITATTTGTVSISTSASPLRGFAIRCAIPAFKNVEQVTENVAALSVPGFPKEESDRLASFYRSEVEPNIRGPY